MEYAVAVRQSAKAGGASETCPETLRTTVYTLDTSVLQFTTP
jgi:hypothetical protein